MSNNNKHELWFNNKHKKSFFVWDLDECTTSKTILLYLEMRANGKAVAWPTESTIAKDCGISEKTVKNIINGYPDKKGTYKPGLIDKGYIKKEKQKNGSNMYHLFFPQQGKTYTGHRIIWKHEELKASEKLLWMCCEKYMTQPYSNWPGLKKIAEECQLTYRTALNIVNGYEDKRYAINEKPKRIEGLLERGRLRKIKRDSGPDIYVPVYPAPKSNSTEEKPFVIREATILTASILPAAIKEQVKQLPVGDETVTPPQVKQLPVGDETVTPEVLSFKSFVNKKQQQKEETVDVASLNLIQKMTDKGIAKERSKYFVLVKRISEKDLKEAVTYIEKQSQKKHVPDKAAYLAHALENGYYKKDNHPTRYKVVDPAIKDCGRTGVSPNSEKRSGPELYENDEDYRNKSEENKNFMKNIRQQLKGII